MADHQYVELVIGWLEDEWNSSNYPGSGGDGGGLNGKIPAFVDGDDGESESYEGREVFYDLQKNNAIVVDSSPNRSNSPIGSEYNYSFEDAVAIEVAGFAGSYGHCDDAEEFQALLDELRRVINANREWPDPDGDQVAYSLGIFDESNLSSQYGDLLLAELTATLEGFEILD